MPAMFASAALAASAPVAKPAANPAAANFHQKIEPLLEKYCYDCHGNGLSKGKVSFEEFESDSQMLARHGLWQAVLKNVRAGIMPPKEEDDAALRPTPAEITQITDWIKYEAFGIDATNPDPGHVVARRLNRVEYRNTIRDLMGTDFNAEAEFPPDDTGGGFDNMGEVLTISPLLLEKYLAAAETIVDKAVPKIGRVMREIAATGRDFKAEGAPEAVGRGRGGGPGGPLLAAKKATTVTKKFSANRDDAYKLSIEFDARGSFDFDASRCNVIGRIDGKELFTDLVVWAEKKAFTHEFDLDLKAGEHVVSFEVAPLEPAPTVAKLEPYTPPVDEPVAEAPEKPKAPVDGIAAVVAAAAGPIDAKDGKEAAPAAPRVGPPRRPPTQTRLDIAIVSVKLKGPKPKEFWIAPENHVRFFPDGPAPEDAVARDAYASKVLRQFATKAFRRPVDDKKVTQLVQVARNYYTQPNVSFEEGVGHAMMAVLASPRFLFRVEEPDPRSAKVSFAPIDEYALASRLSYFLWSTMPDDELMGLAERGELRRELTAQVNRMIKDPKSTQGLVRNFTGQWLQARDVETVEINAKAVLGLSNARGNVNTNNDFNAAIRKAMRSETEMYFEHVLREDCSVLDFIDSDYAFLNARLATQYGVPDVTGDQIHLVKLPPNSPRGGVLTQGTILAVTSNPTRTSPVKRGVFLLDNILGTPAPPPPPNVPALEETKKEFKDREPKLSEILALHRSNAICSSCHQRMDPLGLAFENFNALGNWRDEDAKQPIDPSGRLITGESFKDVRELKHILATERRLDFYRCLTQKMLTYALGRGLDYRDTVAVDTIVDRLVRDEGKMSALIFGIVESVPFQKQRTQTSASATASLSVN